MSSGRQLIIHEVHRPPAPLLRYVDQVAPEESSDIKFRFSRSVLTDFDVDVVHLLDTHLDMLLGTKNAGPFQRFLAVKVLTANLRKHGIALVRTLPDAWTDGAGSRAGSPATRMLDKATTAFVVFDESTPTPDASRTVVIPHAHFRDRFKGYPRGETIEGRLLCIARGELPSASSRMIGVPRATNTAGVSVRLAGEATEHLAQSIRSAAARHPSRVSARLERLSDGARVQEIDAAELVAVPEIGGIADLQTVYLALSLDRPVIVPRTPHMVALAAEVGTGWLHLTDGPITAAAVDDALGSLRRARSRRSPRFIERDLQAVMGKYSETFKRSALIARGRGRTKRWGR